MDNLTHSLVGLMMARVSGRRAAMMVVAANLPDIDVVAMLGSQVTYLEYHRGLTHSLAAAPLLALIPMLLFRRRDWASYSGCLAGVLSHLLLDWTNIYGVRLLMPFSSRWMHLDITDVADPWILLALLLAVAAPALAGLVSSEIGAKTSSGAKFGWAWAALAFLMLYEGGRNVAHQRALSMVGARLWNGRPALRISAMPNRWSPFAWRGIIEGEGYAINADVDLPNDVDSGRIDYSSPPDQAVLKTRPFEVFARFNQVPFWKSEKLADGTTEVRLIDLRFGTPDEPGFMATAIVDESGAVKESQFGFGRLPRGK
ncbi:MAG TPA: metal-dependent hydrolase [Bryobacteraceae bacterium]|nr:metal-dependent hydrolase [Bryobacteraceae bacterium]